MKTVYHQFEKSEADHGHVSWISHLRLFYRGENQNTSAYRVKTKTISMACD